MGKLNRQRRRMKESARRRSTAKAPAEGTRAPTEGLWGPAEGTRAPTGGLWAPREGLWVPSDQPPIEEQVALAVAAALRALAQTDKRAFEVASARVADRSGAVGWRGTTARLLADYLKSAVSIAWDHGWEPADLDRVVSRRLSTRHVSLIRDAIAAQLQRYATATIDPRWTSQLVDLEARVWWRPEQNHLRAWAHEHRAEWSVTVSSALEVLNLITGLPELEKLTPIPGTARPNRSGSRTERAAIDARVLGRIRALLAKAESSTFPAEAETFTAGAQSLMARHSIDHALLASLNRGSTEEPGGRRIGIDNPYDAPKAMLLTAVADANRCRTVWSRGLGFSTVIGFPADLDAVELLFTSLLVQATTAMMQAGSRTDGYGRSRTRSFRQSFLTAYASRIGQRLAQSTSEQTTKAASEPAGQNLLPVLAARSEAVDDAIAVMFPQVTNHVMGPGTNREGWFAGFSAANRAALHDDGELLG